MSRYREYLRSDVWRQKRALVLQRSDGTCELCGGTATQVHHVQYPKTLGTETLDSLVAVCEQCHRKSHGIVEYPEVNIVAKRVVPSFDGRDMEMGVGENGQLYTSLRRWADAMCMHQSLRPHFDTMAEAVVLQLNQIDSRGDWKIPVRDRYGYRWPVVARALREFYYAHRDELRVRVAPVGKIHEHRLWHNVDALLHWGDGLAEQELKRRFTGLAEQAAPPTPMQALRQMFDVVEDHETRIAKLEGPQYDANEYVTVARHGTTRNVYLKDSLDGRGGELVGATVGKWLAEHAAAYGVAPGPKVKEADGNSSYRYEANTWPRSYIDQGFEVFGLV